jgi:lysyl-tRNA synthetase class 2
MRVPLPSTSLAWVSYDARLRRLLVEFRSGKRYLYLGVPPTCYQQLLQADSKGRYFNAHIRNRFPHQELSQPSATLVLVAAGKTK